jgi:hypothetical protein
MRAIAPHNGASRSVTMRTFVIAAVLSSGALVFAQQPAARSPLRSILLQELRETHNQKNWFVSEKEAVAGLTPEQAAWSDGKNHSVGQLVQHLNFWNASNFARLKHEQPRQAGNNDETFTFDRKQWDAALKQFDRTMTELEQFVASRDDATLEAIAPTVALIAQHNAYHIGEMVTSRKKQGSWNPELGVK